MRSTPAIRTAATAIAVVALAGLGAAPATGAPAAPPVFDASVKLPGHGGAEPSMAIDRTASATRGAIYVSSIGGWGSSPPSGDPAGSGSVLWRSTDGGKTFAPPVGFDTASPLGGQDGDVAVLGDGSVAVVDLNITHALVQVSTDQGRTFNQGAITAPEDDRPWLAANGQDVYVFYHDFAGELPGICTSHDGGQTFLPCSYVSLTDPVVASNCVENTNVAKTLAVDPTNGTVNVVFACSTLQGNLANPPYGSLHDYYLAQSTDGGLTFTDHAIYKADVSGGKGPSYGNFWPAFAIDGAGNYYAVWAGTADDPNVVTNPYHIYMVSSHDHGATWNPPVQVDRDANHAGTHVEAAIVAGAAGQVDIAWYGTTATGEPNGVCESSLDGLLGRPASPCPGGLPARTSPTAPPWHVHMAQSTDALSAAPTFTQVQATRAPAHWGELCVNGIVCGSSDRTLLDFISVDLDCQGRAHIAYSGNTKAEEAVNAGNGAANVFVANQVGGSTLAPQGHCPAVAGPGPSPLESPSPPPSGLPNSGAPAVPPWAVVLVLAVTLAAGFGARRRVASRRPRPKGPGEGIA